MNMTTVITVNGTAKSQRGIGLDEGERSRFTIRPGEYSRDIHSVEDLIAQIEQSAYSRGEWISSFSIDGVDLVERLVKSTLTGHHRDVDATIQVLGTMGMFCNADGDDLTSMVMRLKDELTDL
jgi:hypothetical protein